MADETVVVNGEENDGIDEIDAIGQLKQELATLKANTVSKEQYNKLKKAYVEGGSLSADEKEPTLEEKKKDFEETVIRMYNNEGDNLDHGKDLLHFRDLCIDLYKRDPFLPSAGDISQEDIDAYSRAAELYEYAIETAEGDTSVYNTAFGSKLKDVPGVMVNKTNRR